MPENRGQSGQSHIQAQTMRKDLFQGFETVHTVPAFLGWLWWPWGLMAGTPVTARHQGPIGGFRWEGD